RALRAPHGAGIDRPRRRGGAGGDDPAPARRARCRLRHRRPARPAPSRADRRRRSGAARARADRAGGLRRVARQASRLLGPLPRSAPVRARRLRLRGSHRGGCEGRPRRHGGDARRSRARARRADGAGGAPGGRGSGVTRPARVLIVAWEASGDLYGGLLMRAMQAAPEDGGGTPAGPRDAVRFTGIGGDAMRDAGLASLADASVLGVTGVVEVAARFGAIWRAY